MPDESPRRRGRPPRAEPAEQTGYRITASVRRQLLLAMAFTDARTTQEVIDRAVQEFLARLRESVPGFADAAEAAAGSVSGRPGKRQFTAYRTKRGHLRVVDAAGVHQPGRDERSRYVYPIQVP